MAVKVRQSGNWVEVASGGVSNIPAGVIVLWSGAENLIGSSEPGGTGSGWVLCDGQNNTPDLRNRFIVGAGTGSIYSVNATGGANEVTLTESQLAQHDHGSGNYNTSNVNNHTHGDGNYNTNNVNDHTHGDGNYNTNNSGNHTHPRSFGGTTNSRFTSESRLESGTQNDNRNWNNTGDGGDHSHNVDGNSGPGGGHTHNVEGNSGGGGAHDHNIDGNSGNAGSGSAHENRPPYYALCYIMKT